LKRNFGLFTALSAGSGIHLARAAIEAAAAAAATFGSSAGTASRTALGLICIAFGRKELLLFNGKGESFSAIGTLKCFLGVAHCMTSFFITWFNLGSSNALMGMNGIGSMYNLKTKPAL
jgi:hypothetical protein